MKTIYKYPVELNDRFTLSLPKKALLLTVQMQYGDPQLWALVDTNESTEERYFILRGTGHPIDDKDLGHLEYINTFQVDDGRFVFHLFEYV